jgi:integrase
MAEKFNFIKTKLDGLAFDPNVGKSKNYYADEKINGLVLELTPKNLKTFQVYKKINGKPVRVKLGRYPDMTIDQARRIAQGKLSEMAEGINPNQAKKTAKIKGITLKEVFNDYLKAKKNLKAGTVYDYTRTVEYYFKDWQDKPLVSITRDMVERKHSQIGETAKAPANKSMRVLRALFNFAAQKYEDENGKALFPDNPVKRISGTDAWFDIPRRTRHVKEYELKPFFEAITALKPDDGEVWQHAKSFLLITLFTGCRREEGLSLKWSNIDFKLKTLTMDDTKNSQIHVLPLSDFLFDLLAEHRKNTAGISDYVFASKRSKSGHIVNPQRHIDKIIERTGIEFSDHDLRRTFTTTADALDFSLPRIKRLINHSEKSDVTMGYIMRNVEQLRAPMQQITDYILKAAGLKQSAEIIPLERLRVV